MVACARSDTTFHALTGNATTYKEEELGGEHKACITAAIQSTVAAIHELLDVNAQLWVCAACRFEEGHLAIKACTDCGETLAWTLQNYVAGWLRGLLTKSMLGLDMEKGHNLTNFSYFGELLLAPHGLQVGLEFPDHTEMGELATCSCESEEVEEQAVPKVGAGEGGNTVPEINVESMETEEGAALPPGTDSLVKRFCRSANPKSMLELVEGVYNQDLLSRRLQGNSVKDALAITLLTLFRSCSEY